MASNPWTAIRTVAWGKPAETAAERKLVSKIDFFVLSYCCLSYCINYLDRANLANAYVSGMREDVNCECCCFFFFVSHFLRRGVQHVQ